MKWTRSCLVVAAVGLSLVHPACKPDVDSNPGAYEPRLVAVFDPNQGAVPAPNDILMSEGKVAYPTTLVLPDGSETEVVQAAMRELIETYLNGMDGFLPESPLTFDFYSPDLESLSLDAASVARGGVRVFDVTGLLQAIEAGTAAGKSLDEALDAAGESLKAGGVAGAVPEVEGLKFAGQAQEVTTVTGTRLARMTVSPPGTWQAGHTYAVFVLTDVKDDSGRPVVPSANFNFLKSKDPLVAPSANPEVDSTPVSLIPASDADAAALERIRVSLRPVFDYFEEMAPDAQKIPRVQTALAWTFTITTASELVYDPTTGAIPTPNDLLLDQLRHDMSDPEKMASSLVFPAGTDCADQASIDALDEDLRIKAAFFCWLGSLDGFSTTSMATAGFTRPLDPGTVGPDNVVMFDTTGTVPVLVEDAGVAWDQDKSRVVIKPGRVLEPGHTYTVVLLDGLKGADDAYQVIPSPVMAMLKLENALYAEGVSQVPDLLDDASASALELARLKLSGTFDVLSDMEIPRKDVVGLFQFTITSGNEVMFDPNAGIVPFPNEVLMVDSESPDRKVSLPVSPDDPEALAQMIDGLNELAGFSTLGSFTTAFSRPVDLESVSFVPELTEVGEHSVAVADITTVDPSDPTTLATLKLYGPGFFQPFFKEGKLGLTPAPGKPLPPGRRFMVVLTDKLQSQVEGDAQPPPMVVSPTFFLARSKYPLVDSEGRSNLPEVLDDSDAGLLEQLRLAYKPIFDAMNLLGVSRDKILLFYTFWTDTTFDELVELAQSLEDAPKVTGTLSAPDAADAQALFGTHPTAGIAKVCLDCVMEAHVLLSDPDTSDPEHPVMGRFAFDESGAPGFRKKDIPFLLVLPEGSGPFETVVFQHGLDGDRTDLVKFASKLAGAGFASVAMDAPLHGDHPVRLAGTASGTGFFSADVFAVRDNIREAALEQVQLVDALKGPIDELAGGVLDTSQGVGYLGVSLGGIIGAVTAGVEPELHRVALVVPGGHLIRIFTDTPNESFRQPLVDALGSMGIQEGSADFDLFVEFAQWALDRADPVNFAFNAGIDGQLVQDRFLLVQANGDDFIPNSTTQELLGALSIPDGSSPGFLALPQEGTVCHGFFLDGCDPGDYPDLDQAVVTNAMDEAHTAVLDFLGM